jgi:hypothetical protein
MIPHPRGPVYMNFVSDGALVEIASENGVSVPAVEVRRHRHPNLAGYNY